MKLIGSLRRNERETIKSMIKGRQHSTGLSVLLGASKHSQEKCGQ